ncbi:MAG: VWA domain-containing protein, partial [Actinobacteria bacterium]
THVSKRSTGGGRTVAVSATRATVTEDPGVVRGSEAVYPEWDVFRRSYRPGWCTVTEVEPDVDASASVVPPGAHALRRPLARLSMDLERRRRQLQGDEVDVDAAVEARVQLAAGSAPNEAVYIDTVRGRPELAVLVLLDVSGSAAEPSATGVPVHEHQRAAAGALTVALHDLGDRVALYAFRSQGRSAVHILPVKRFDDSFDARVMQRLGGLIPGAYTRLGAAIRHGASVLERDGGTARRLLVVLSDGFAYDHGYEGAYGEADARRALAETRRRGTGCLCLSVGAATDIAALRRVFGTAAHAAIPRATQLAGVVGPLFRSAVASADVQRRLSQRRERTRERLQVERRTA